MSKVILALGSNMGDSAGLLKEAAALIDQAEGINVVKYSSFYATAPIGYTDQADFVNAVISCDTTLPPMDVLALCQHVESQLNRVRLIRWGPRTIDVDIILYDNLVLSEENLTVPHPRMKERAFVMVPLKEIMPELVLENRTIGEICEALADQEIRKMTHEKW